MRTLLSIFMLVALTGCSVIDDWRLINDAQQRIQATLRDQTSVRFRDVRVSSDQISRGIGTVCGEVSSGDFSGWRRFVYARDAGLAAVEISSFGVRSDPDQNSAILQNIALFDDTWRRACIKIP